MHFKYVIEPDFLARVSIIDPNDILNEKYVCSSLICLHNTGKTWFIGKREKKCDLDVPIIPIMSN